ncbi:MAG: efflux RND transporter periplasmic adaptor subunit [Bacteroidota bacterium]
MSVQKLILPAILLLVVFIGYYFYANEGTPAQQTDIKSTIQKGEFTLKVDATGELKAKRSVQIKAPSGMRAERVHQTTIQDMVAEGTIVKEGDYVATLDRTEISNKMGDAQTEIDKILTQLAQGKIDTAITLRGLRDELINLQFAKNEKLLELEQNKYEPQAVIQQKKIDLQKNERDYKQAQAKYQLERDKAVAKIAEINADLKQNKTKLERLVKLAGEFTVKAPKDGMIIYAKTWQGKVTSGSQVSSWNPIVAELPDLSEMMSKTYVNEVDVSNVEKGQDVTIKIDAFPDEEYVGRVVSVANIGEELREYDAKVFEVNIEMLGVDSILRPAMTTSNEIVTDILQDVISVPLEALYSDSLPYVFKDQGGRILKQEVITGPSNNDAVIIDFGLQDGDNIYLSMPDNAKEMKFQPLDPAIKKKIRIEQESREKARLAKLEAKKKEMKDSDVPTQSAGNSGVIFFN